jgi:hypothetical protein
MCDSEIECTLPRIEGIRTQMNTQSLTSEKQIMISEKRTIAGKKSGTSNFCQF